uniref:Uncharacterized protein n=2 Tax=Physcomitrium patens TaxID=3218 RepID=A0A7I4C8T2_PHYPA|nr:uncharacterized protein LOC112274572 isoform X2 [Physcomitrium patens]|eukprot:XP_024360006.1 uncharacterized protein LOC112274572 isoform X2 [Physcomitrella patens]
MDNLVETDPFPSSLPFPIDADTDAFIDELYFRTKNTEGRLPPDSVMNELNESRTELYSRVQTLKKVRTDNFASFIPALCCQDLKDWRGMLDNQVKSYREEIGDLRDSLNSEVERLKTEFKKLRSTLNDQNESEEMPSPKLKAAETSLSDISNE